ncbi:hypothetical protein [Marinimicrobium agarilyticum]|uniref:hypothetical protein n=1 Tax=Marinimicrobium agarilyticum TaxID=306546 RepID=UPI000417B0BE|nr:hypothetical protein [Marinimicrobium agarilyticum]
MRLGILIILIIIGAASAQAGNVIQTVSRGDHNAEYTRAIIRLALDKAGYDYELVVHPGDLSAARQIRDTREGIIDVMWAATSRKTEEQLLPVRVPLFKGLVGHRVFVVHPDNLSLFDDITTVEDLHPFTYGQGVGWPDVQILRDNGFTVREESFDRLTIMVHAKRFEAFPRGVHEPWGELERRPELDLMVEPNIMLVYRMPFYLFVTPHRPELAKALERGLMMALEDGSFDRHFYQSVNVQTTIARAGLSKRRVFYLENRALSEETPLEDPRMWLDWCRLVAAEGDATPCQGDESPE